MYRHPDSLEAPAPHLLEPVGLSQPQDQVLGVICLALLLAKQKAENLFLRYRIERKRKDIDGGAAATATLLPGVILVADGYDEVENPPGPRDSHRTERHSLPTSFHGSIIHTRKSAVTGELLSYDRENTCIATTPGPVHSPPLVYLHSQVYYCRYTDEASALVQQTF